MSSAKNIEESLSQVQIFYTLVKAYQQISSSRMVRTRDSVLKNRDYLERIEEVFKNIRENYAEKILKIGKTKGIGSDSITFLSHNGKKVALFMSTNTGLYGEIVKSTYKEFSKDVESKEFEVAIAGRYGLGMFLADFPKVPYTYFDLEDHKVKKESIEAITKHIVQYDEIHVFYGKYVNVLKQSATKETISSLINIKKDVDKEKRYFLFEPSLEDIMKFFEAQMFNSAFEQTVYESQLAKYASRLIAMNRAEDNIKTQLDKLSLAKLRAMHESRNKKQINTMQAIFVQT